MPYTKQCMPKCGAIRQDSQIGLEETPEEYVEKLVNVFKEVRNVLTDDGTCWVNLGDSYYNWALEKDKDCKTKCLKY